MSKAARNIEPELALAGIDTAEANSDPEFAPRSVFRPAALRFVFSIGLVLLLALWLRLPLINHGLPYIYDEDEGHHFNRVVRMLKTGDLNPKYFLKPALHFYLRLPITAVAFFKSVERGELRELGEIKTQNPYGLARYEYTVSHPLLVKFNRAFSLLISLAVIGLTIGIGYRMGIGLVGVLAGLMLTLAPGHFAMSTHIGVDMLMAFFVSATVLLSLSYLKTERTGDLVIAALCAGLAVASKYNAFFAILVPLVAFITTQLQTQKKQSFFSLHPLFACIVLGLLSVAAFLAGAPYSLLALPDFLNGAAYEVWHYKHSHPAPSGLPQVAFYFKWFGTTALGWAILTSALLGFASSFFIFKQRRVAIVLAVFPLLYFAYMCSQQLNFTRNMIPMLPFVCFYAALFLWWICRPLASNKKLRVTLPLLLTILVCIIPAKQLLADRIEKQFEVDSRARIASYLEVGTFRGKNIAIPGDVLMPHTLRAKAGVFQYSAKGILKGEASFVDLWQRGADIFVMPGSIVASAPETVSFAISGKETFPQRIVKDPELHVRSADEAFVSKTIEHLSNQALSSVVAAARGFDPLKTDGLAYGWGDAESPEGEAAYRWTSGRYAAYFMTPADAKRISLKLFSPWTSQTLTVVVNGAIAGTLKLEDRTWKQYSLDLPKFKSKDPMNIELIASRSGSLAEHQLSADPRILAVAVAEIELQ